MESLYVGDLHESVTDDQLFEAFSEFENLTSVSVCRDSSTGRSLCYGYVSFISTEDAVRAIEVKNHSTLNGKVIRVSWSRRDSDVRRSGTGNMFIKNLNDTIDNGKLEEIFQKFGNILSCKVAVFEDGRSKGYGFVQFETEDSANAAIEELNGSVVGGKEMYVGRLLKSDRILLSPEEECTILFINNLGLDISEEHLREKFSEFGKIINFVIAKDENGGSKGFGFVNFENPDDARTAREAINESKLGCNILYVSRAQTKTELEEILRHLSEKRMNEQLIKFQGSTLYVKNINGDVKDRELRELFSQCGNITSAKLMLDEKGVSRGFGFVCFSTPEEANKAVNTFHGFMFGQKPLHVAIAQRKEERQTQLQIQHAEGIAGLTGSSSFYPSTVMRKLELDEMWANIPKDLFGTIRSLLVGKDYVNFGAVCKSFLEAPWVPSNTDLSQTRLLTLESDSGIVRIYDPLLNTIPTSLNPHIPELVDSELLSARGLWVLMCQQHRKMFFFNVRTNRVISLPERIDTDDYCTNWTFTSSPDLSDCFVIGFVFAGCPPAVYIIQQGEAVWQYHELFDDINIHELKLIMLTISYNPVVMEDCIYIVGDEGDLGMLTLRESSAECPTWVFFGTPLTEEEQKKVSKIYTVVDSDNELSLIVIFRMDIENKVEIWRYTLIGNNLETVKLTTVEEKVLFLSCGSSFLKVCPGFENKAFFPMLHQNEGVFYCFSKQNYLSYSYAHNTTFSSQPYLSMGGPVHAIWIDDET